MKTTSHLSVILTLLLATLMACSSPAREETAVSRALDWLRSQQGDDGSIPNDVAGAYNGTSQAVLAIVAGNQDPDAWRSSEDNSPLDFLVSQAITQTDTITETGTTAWLTLAVVAAEENPRDFGGVNLVQRLQEDYDPATGQYGLAGDVPTQALAMMAVRAAGQTVPVTATDLLKGWQDPGGGWGFAHPCLTESGCAIDVDNTALVLQALIAAGEPLTSTVVISATGFLKGQQEEDGGFQSWGTSNANSTAWGIQALIAAGHDPAGVDWTKNGHTPVSFLLSLQADAGHFEYSSPPPDWEADRVLNTVQAILALAGNPLIFPSGTSSTGADDPSRVGLVVRFSDGHLLTRWVEFDEDQISGLEALRRSGLDVIYQQSGLGTAVCKIEDEGCDYPSEPCFCRCAGGPDCLYWSYWHLQEDTWEYSQAGASGYFVRDGDVEGWAWGEQPGAASAGFQ